MNTDTPLPQEEPAGENPPDGAIIDYYINGNAKDVSLEISDSKGKLIRIYSSMSKPYEFPALNIPLYWIRPQAILSGKPGSHRFTWDMHYEPLIISPSYPIAATYMNTSPAPTSPYVLPGIYTINLTVRDNDYVEIHKQQFEIKMDPRVKTSMADLQKQHGLSLQCYEGRKGCMNILKEIKAYRSMLQSQLTNAEHRVAERLGLLERQAGQLENTPQGSQEPSFGRLNNSFASIINLLQGNDMPPTAQTIASVAELKKQFDALVIKWTELKSKQ
jgi:transcriptional regulator with XRE-family HTH domain